MTLSEIPTSVGIFDRIEPMHSKTILWLGFWLAVLLLVLHEAGIVFYFYWLYWWYDVLVHWVAGLTAGFSTYWVLWCSGWFFSRQVARLELVMALVVTPMLIVAVGWEVFEYVYNIADPLEGYALDVTNDIVLGCCGAALAVLIATRKGNHSSINSL